MLSGQSLPAKYPTKANLFFNKRLETVMPLQSHRQYKFASITNSVRFLRFYKNEKHITLKLKNVIRVDNKLK